MQLRAKVALFLSLVVSDCPFVVVTLGPNIPVGPGLPNIKMPEAIHLPLTCSNGAVIAPHCLPQ